MAKYSYITDKTHNNRKIQVESAKRDGSGKNIENNYAKQNGNYQSFTAGLANNFDTKLTEKDESAYNFRPTATMGSMELEVGSPCKVKKIIGGSVAFNQAFAWNNGVRPWVSTGGSVTKNGSEADPEAHFECPDTTTDKEMHKAVSATNGHKYFISFSYKSNYDFNVQHCSGNNVFTASNNYVSVSLIKLATSPYIPTNGTAFQLYFYNYSGANNNWDLWVKNVMCIDLTQMFGSTIADYIYSLEQANAGSGVAWFKRYFPKEYYAYNSGELVSVKTQGKKITHFNQWDEEWELGELNPSTGGTDSSNSRIRSKNFIKVLPSTAYYIQFNTTTLSTGRIACYDANNNYLGQSGGWLTANSPTMFTTPSNCHYIKFVFVGTTYNHDICINFHYDGERDGEYEPYNSETYPIEDIELRGIPQLDENNNLTFDGDEYLADGNVTRKYGIVDLSTLSFARGTLGSDKQGWYVDYSLAKSGTYGYVSNIVAEKYNPKPSGSAYVTENSNDIIIEQRTPARIWVFTDSNTSPSGYLVYELATPTDENSIPFTEVQECDNWGTEEWLAPTTDTRPCEVPVGHETDYLPDLKAKLEVAPTTPNENGVYVMEHNASGNTYTLIGTWLADNGYVKSTDVANGYGTKDALGGTLRQLLATKESLDFSNTAYVDMGSLNWAYSENAQCFTINLQDKANGSSKLLSTLYKTENDKGFAVSNMCITGATGSDTYNKTIFVKNTSYNDATAFKNAMKGVLLAYEKAS